MEIVLVNFQLAISNVIVARLCRLMCGKPPAFRGQVFGFVCYVLVSKDKVESGRKGRAFPHIKRRSREILLRSLISYFSYDRRLHIDLSL